MQLDLDSKDRIIQRLKEDWGTDRLQWKCRWDECHHELDVLQIERDSLRAHILQHAPHIIPPALALHEPGLTSPPGPEAANGFSYAPSPRDSSDARLGGGLGSESDAPSSSQPEEHWPDAPAAQGLSSRSERADQPGIGRSERADQPGAASAPQRPGSGRKGRRKAKAGLSDNAGMRQGGQAVPGAQEHPLPAPRPAAVC